MRIVSGACVRSARFAAALGRPMPTNSAAPLRTMRAAAMVIISSDVYSGRAKAVPTVSGMGRRLLEAPFEIVEVARVDHVPLDPRAERLTFARDQVPLLIERVVARVVAGRVGGKRA